MINPIRKISVLQVLYSLKVGGSEKLAFEISSHLDRSQFNPSVCALDLSGDLTQDLDREKIHYNVLCRQGLELDILRRLYRLIKTNRVDIVHTHHFTQLFFAALPARLAGARIIHTEHECFSYMESAFTRAMIKPLSSLCHGMTVVGPEVAGYFVRTIGIPRKRVLIIPNGVDITKFTSDRSTVRHELGIAEHEMVIGTVGRLEPEKDQKTLLEAFRLVREVQPMARLVIAGSGGMAQELQSYARRIGIAEYTSFLGTRRDVPRLLSGMDIFVLSSVREGLPISLIEAMAARKPVVASDIGSVRDLVRHDENGLLAVPGDIAAFSRSLLRLIESSHLRERMGDAGRLTVERSFSLPVMIRAYEGLYRSALEKPHVWN